MSPRDPPKIMIKPRKVRDALKAAHEAPPIGLSINCFLIEAGPGRSSWTGLERAFDRATPKLLAVRSIPIRGQNRDNSTDISERA
jgi:hypothetical protein